MTANDILIRQLTRQTDAFIRTAAKVPAEKFSWTPDPSLRSALDQYQEVATIVKFSWDLYTTHKLEFNEEDMAKMNEYSSQFQTHEQLEAELRAQTAKLIEYTQSLGPEDLKAPVSMPWPGEFTVADIIFYHTWNMSYHEGQISALLMRMDIDPMG